MAKRKVISYVKSGCIGPVLARSTADREVRASNPTLAYREFQHNYSWYFIPSIIEPFTLTKSIGKTLKVQCVINYYTCKSCLNVRTDHRFN